MALLLPFPFVSLSPYQEIKTNKNRQTSKFRGLGVGPNSLVQEDQRRDRSTDVVVITQVRCSISDEIKSQSKQERNAKRAMTTCSYQSPCHYFFFFFLILLGLASTSFSATFISSNYIYEPGFVLN